MRLRLYKALKLAVPRAVLATLLVLGLLSSLTPFSASSSSPLHPCTMACCAGKPPHEAASCSIAIACHVNTKKRPSLEPEAPNETGEPSASHHHEMMQMADVPTVDVTSSMHLQDTNHHPARPAAPQDARGRESGVASGSALSSGCREDCGAVSFISSGEGRQRDPASLSYAGQPRPPSKASLSLSGRSLLRPLAVLRGKLIPRAPPAFFS